MKAFYCTCKNTYTINNCDKCKEGYSALRHGIGPLTGQGNSVVTNTSALARVTGSSSSDEQL